MSAAETLAVHWICACGEGRDLVAVAERALDGLRAAGYAVVGLPEPKGLGAVDSVPYWPVLFGGEPEDIYPLDSGEVRISGFDDMSVEVARTLAAALLVAANAAEGK